MEKQIKISKKLEKARLYEAEALMKGTKAEKPFFHVSAPVGWINDPNGFSEFKGEKHLFFQYHPYDTNWGPMHWGHVKTTDFIKWENLPVALAPDKKYDNFGCFSGSAIEYKGKHVIAYTGVERKKEDGKITDYQRQCIAVGDGVNYKKSTVNPVITSEQVPAGGSALDFRDPKIWEEEDGIYMVVANRAEDGSGQILMYKTADLKKWEFVSILDQCENRYGKMWECPDLFHLDGKDILITSPQEMMGEGYEFHAGDGAIVVQGEYEKESHTIKEQSIKNMDYGTDFYAPQTMLTADGRRVMIAWMQAWCGNWFTPEDGFCGMMTVPRELSVRDGVLYQTPVREIANYYTDTKELKNIRLGAELQSYDELAGRVQDMELTLTGEAGYQFELRIAGNDTCYTSIKYDSSREELIFDRSCSGVRRDAAHVRIVKVAAKDQKVKLRILQDRYSVEVFVNDGEKALTSVIRTPFEVDGVAMRAEGNVVVDVVKHNIG